jgi:uncharacterized protein YhbP (UPF0306 family)
MNSAVLLEFIRKHRVAVQASVSPATSPQAAVIGIAVSDRFEIVFDTIETTRKAEYLRRNSKVALVIGGLEEGDERTVQFEGEADEPTGTELERLKAVYYSTYPDGPDRANWPGLIYVRVRPTWVRYSDYNVNPPQIIEFGGHELS